MSGFGRFSNGAVNLVRNERGNSTRTLLLALLLVIAGGGYLYFFTDLIRSNNETAKPSATSSVPVKKPLPPRSDQQAGEPVSTKPEDSKSPTKTPSTQVAAVAPVKPAPEVKPTAIAVPPAKQEAPKVAKAEKDGKAAPPAASTKAAAQPVQSAPAKAEPVKPRPESPKDAPVAKAGPEVKAPAKTAAAAKTEKTKKKKNTGAYTLLIGDFVPDKTLDAVLAKLKKNSLSPVKKEVVTATKPMNRLFIADFSDQDTAVAELQKLKKLTGDAFLIAENGTYSLYAGSYYTENRLKMETGRLAAKGVNPVVRKIQLAIKVTRVRAGSYSSLEEARKAAKILNAGGLSVGVVKTGA